jgi:inner membrane protein
MLLLLLLLLVMPLDSLDSMLRERLSRRNNVVSEIHGTWGPSQHVVGPCLVVPYKHWYKVWRDQVIEFDDKGEPKRVKKVEVPECELRQVYFLPEELNIAGTLAPKKLHRSIYETVVYAAQIKLSGRFVVQPDKLKIKVEDVVWEDAQVTMAIADLRGASEAIQIKFGEGVSQFMPGCKIEGYTTGISAPVKITGEMVNKDIAYEMDLKFQGSQIFAIAPVGVKNTVKLTSSWPDPSFQGAFLPSERTVTNQGFEAMWQVSFYGRDYPQLWTDKNDKNEVRASAFNSSLFGVALLTLVDSYRSVERAVNYGQLFIAVILAVFFLFEILCALKIHPFQYLLVAAALSLFYLLLLAVSEFLDFILAYAIGAGVASLLIFCYSFAVLKSGKRTLVILAGLVINYTFLYFILQMQDYSLLTGSFLLSLLLAAVMYTTRKVNWYKQNVAKDL